jgi:hypothetical protein
MKCITLAILSVGLLSAACATPDPIRTASGKPDTTLRNVGASCVKNEILSGLVSKGWTIKTATDTQIVAQRPFDNAVLSTLMSTRNGGAPQVRATYTMIPIGDEVRLVLDPAIIVNPGTSQEQVNPTKPDNEMQTGLVNASRRVETVCTKAKAS